MTREPRWIHAWRVSVDTDLALHEKVLTQGYPNRWGARIELEHRWNLQLFQELLADYEDNDIIEWMKYGWPAGRLPTMEAPQPVANNHKGACEHPEALRKVHTKGNREASNHGPLHQHTILSQVQSRNITPQHPAKKGLTE